MYISNNLQGKITRITFPLSISFLGLVLGSCVHIEKLQWSDYPNNFFLKDLASLGLMLGAMYVLRNYKGQI